MKLIECVPNFSEGKNRSIVDSIVTEIASVNDVKILDVELDANHNRSVVSFTSPPEVAVEAAFRGIRKAAELIDMDSHKGEHPRFGASDVIPFIPVSDVSLKECVELARELGKRVGEEINIPVFLYSDAATTESRKNLENIRNRNFQYEQIRVEIGKGQYVPDFGPLEVSKAGVSIIGARNFLVAYNVNLNSQNMEIGKKIAKALRAKDGGLAFVKALAFYLDDKKCVQISMNLTNFKKTPIYRAYEMVKLEASRYGVEIIESEVIGLVPLEAIVESSRFFLRMNEFKSNQIFETRVWE